MFDEKTLLTRLQNGEDPQAIADAMAKMLNQANQTYQEQKKAAEAQAKAKATQEQKAIEMQEILDDICTWLCNYTDFENVDEVFEEIDAETVIEAIDALGEYAKLTVQLKNLGNPVVRKPAARPVTQAPKVSKVQDPDEVLQSFLKGMGL